MRDVAVRRGIIRRRAVTAVAVLGLAAAAGCTRTPPRDRAWQGYRVPAYGTAPASQYDYYRRPAEQPYRPLQTPGGMFY